jgi:uncharacterized membrane protein YfcA
LEFLFVLAVGIVAGTLSGIVGFGSSIMLMPVLVIAFGPLQAVPIMAIAAVMANISRVLVWWSEVDWRSCGAFAATGAPAGALGAATLAVYLAKTAVFRGLGALPLDIALKGLVTGSTLMAGAFLAKRFVLKLPPERFRLLTDGLMLASGLTLLAAAFF